MPDNSNNPQLNELVSFIQHDLPGLEDGQYQLQVSQEVKDEAGNVVSDGTLSVNYKFAVTGDRFSLAQPAQTLYSVFPADLASGKYDAVLPHVVFSKPTFPWTRSPLKAGNVTPLPAPGQDTDAEVPTWLTVLLLDEDDVANYIGQFPEFSLAPTVGRISDLFLTSVLPVSTLQDNYSYFYEVTNNDKPLTTYLDPGQQMTDSLQMLDIPVPLFQKIAPSTDDLKLMAHVRRVSLINKPTMQGISDQGEPVGSFSIVFGNRVPASNKKNYAFLVSLEALQDFLPPAQNQQPSGFNPDQTKMLRIAVLNSWSFFTTGDSAGFVAQLNALNQAQPPVNHEVNTDLSLVTNLRLPPRTGALPQVANALEMGYVPLNHNLRSGTQTGNTFIPDKTVSWYRGPLLPYKLNKPALELPIASPDQVLVFDPTTGMLDTSYAAAWTLGRQVALQDTGFSTQLYNWKKGLELAVLNSAELQLLTEHFANVFHAAPRAVPPMALSADPSRKRNNNKRQKGNFLRNTLLSLHTQKR